MRTFAGRGCGPLGPDGPIPTAKQARSRADGPATPRSSPPPGGGCGLPVAARPILPASRPHHDRTTSGSNCQRTKLRLPIAVRPNHSEFGCGLRSTPATLRSCGPPPGGGCGLPVAARPILPASRPHHDRAISGTNCQRTKLRAAGRCATESFRIRGAACEGSARLQGAAGLRSGAATSVINCQRTKLRAADCCATESFRIRGAACEARQRR